MNCQTFNGSKCCFVPEIKQRATLCLIINILTVQLLRSVVRGAVTSIVIRILLFRFLDQNIFIGKIFFCLTCVLRVIYELNGREQLTKYQRENCDQESRSSKSNYSVIWHHINRTLVRKICSNLNEQQKSIVCNTGFSQIIVLKQIQLNLFRTSGPSARFFSALFILVWVTYKCSFCCWRHLFLCVPRILYLINHLQLFILNVYVTIALQSACRCFHSAHRVNDSNFRLSFPKVCSILRLTQYSCTIRDRPKAQCFTFLIAIGNLMKTISLTRLIRLFQQEIVKR